QARQHCGLVFVLDQRDIAVAGDHRRAAFGVRAAVEADHRDVVQVTRGRDLVAHSCRWHRHLRQEHVRFLDPAHVALEDHARIERIAGVGDVFRGNGPGEHVEAVVLQRVDDAAVERHVRAAAADGTGQVDRHRHGNAVYNSRRMSREIVINATRHESRIAVLDEGQVVELWVERTRHRTVVGNIYKGRVTKVLPGMQSAFVELGLERDAFLYVSDVVEDFEEYETESRDDLTLDEAPRGEASISDLLREGQEIVVQVSKDTIAGKGA